MSGGRYLTVAQIAEHSGFSMRTVLRWIKAGELPAVKFPGGRLRISESAYFELQARCSTMGQQRIVAITDEEVPNADG